MIYPLLMIKIGKLLDKWEDPIPYMYLDSEGLVTVGCGTMLPSATAAAQIPFLHENSAMPATLAEIQAAWNRLHTGSATQKAAAPQNKHLALHYKSASDLRITRKTASSLRDVHVRADYENLKKIYSNFDSLPDDAKLALFDMIYNIGAGRAKSAHHRASGLRAFSTLHTAILQLDWEGAAKACFRHGISFARNANTAALFRSCLSAPAKAPAA